jgi:tetratricopeptide (TPR) repeat protein
VLNTLLQVQSRDPIPPRRSHAISRDLETICLKCLAKQPNQRYPTALALAEDLRRYLDGEPVQARPVPVWQRIWRSARRRPWLVARILGGVALLCVLLSCAWYLRVAAQLARQRAEQKYRQFVLRRDEALVQGLLAPDDGALFLGAAATAHRQAAESAAREALALAGVELGSQAPAVAPSWPAARRSAVAADCYTLLLVLASVQGQQPLPDRGANRYQEALQTLDVAHKLGVPTRAYHLRRAYFLQQTGAAQEARTEQESAEACAPKSDIDHFLIGEEQYRRGDWQAARASFKRALAVQPAQFWARFFLAVCHLKAQQWEAARAGLNACLAQQPNFVWAYLFRSFANEKLQALPAAQADFHKALQLPLNAEARYVLFLMRGIHHFHQSEPDLAAADFCSAMDLMPDQYNAYVNLASLYLVQGRFEQADEEVRKALRLQPPVQVVFAYHLDRSRHLLRQKRCEEAVQACAAALALAPREPGPLAVRGQALLQLGRYTQATAVLPIRSTSGLVAGSPKVLE